MRRTAALIGAVTAAAVAIVALLAMRGVQPREQAGGQPPLPHQSRRPPPGAAPAPLGIAWSDGPVALARLDPRTLRPRRPSVGLGEYHNAWSFSPDGAQLAVAISSPGNQGVPVVGERGRIGIRVVDAQRMRVVRDISTGVAAEALGWLAPRRLAAVLQSGEAIVVDPVTGALLWQREVGPGSLLNPRWARLRDRLLVLVDAPPFPRLANIDAQGVLRVAPLERQRPGCCGAWSRRAGLAVDAARERAFVVAAGVPAAEVDLRAMRVSYHQVVTPGAALLPPPGTVPQESLQASQRQALWLGAGALAVFGQQRSPDAAQTSATPAGVAILDTHDWKVRMVQAQASHACVVAGRLLVYRAELPGPRARGLGLRIYSLQGQGLAHLLGDEPVSRIEASGDRAHVYSPTAVRVVDPRSGAVVHTLPPQAHDVELLGGLCEP